MFGFLCNSFFLSEKTVSFVNSTDYLKSIARHPFPRSLEVVSLHRMQRIHLIAMIIMIV